MGFETERPAIFRRASKAEENYLVLMHYMAGVLWARHAGVEAMDALSKVLASATRRASVAGAAQPREATSRTPHRDQ